MESMKSKPIAKITAIWDKGSVSQYPETLRVPMEDGHVVNYRIDQEKQPHPAFLFAMNILKNLPDGSYKSKRRLL